MAWLYNFGKLITDTTVKYAAVRSRLTLLKKMEQTVMEGDKQYMASVFASVVGSVNL